MMNIQNKNQWLNAFFDACQAGHLEKVQKLCEKKYIDLKWACWHEKDEYGFRLACGEGHLSIIKYLLESPELLKRGLTPIDLHALSEDGFRRACARGYLNVIQYLLTSSELKAAGHAFANPHALADGGFRVACEKERWNVVEWLMMEYKIDKTDVIERILQTDQVQNYWRSQREHAELKNTINSTFHFQQPSKDQKALENISLSVKNDGRAPKKAKKL